VSNVSIWDKYPNLTSSELNTLVALTAQTLLESQADRSVLPSGRLDVSPATAARELTPALQEVDPEISRQQIQGLLEDETLSTQVCLRILDEVRGQPELADRIAEAYEQRSQKMTGVELVLLAGALVILAIRIKEIHFGDKKVVFDPAGKAVEAFVAALPKLAGGGG
jgi:hypothetical protein